MSISKEHLQNVHMGKAFETDNQRVSNFYD